MKTGRISIKIMAFMALTAISIAIGYYAQKPQASSIVTVATKDPDLYKLTEGSSRESFLTLLNEQEKALWDCLKEEEGVSQKDFAYYTNLYASDYEKKEKERVEFRRRGSASQKLRTLIRGILCEFSIDPRTITIVPYDGNEAAALTNFIFVNEDKLKSYDEKTQRWIIAHEIIHLLKGDCLRTTILKILFEEKFKDPEHVVNRMMRFEEMRADLLSSLNGKEYAEGCIGFLDKHIQEGADLHSYATHPEYSLRLKTAQQVYDKVYKSGNLIVA
jgi:hypothetical protein